MTSRELIQQAIAHREPGRVPVDMGATQLKNMNFFDQTCFPCLDDYPENIEAMFEAVAEYGCAVQ